MHCVISRSSCSAAAVPAGASVSVVLADVPRSIIVAKVKVVVVIMLVAMVAPISVEGHKVKVTPNVIAAGVPRTGKPDE